MPARAPRPCSKPGCGTLTTQGRCHTHPFQPRQRGRQERQYDAARGSARQRGYDAAWEALAKLFLREHPLCEPCDAIGRTTAAAVVDHVRELRDGGARLDETNLQALCRSCHARKTARVAKERRGSRRA